MHHSLVEPLEARIAPAAMLSINDAKVVEGDPDSNPFTPDTVSLDFTVTLSEPNAQPTTFTAATRNGTAVAGEDFTALTRTVTIPAGATSATVSVTVQKDAFFESTESFFVEITNPSANVTVLDGEGRGTIYNDDLQRIDLRTIRYVDVDGDLVTVRITKGVLTAGGPGAVLNFGPTNSIVGGRALQTVDFTRDPVTFNHTDLYVTVAAQPGFSGSGGVSNGRADVGFVQAGIVQGGTFQFVNNIDLNTVVIEGDLGKIVAGDPFAADRAVESLRILSHGVRGTTSGAPDNDSFFLGGATTVIVRGDVEGQLNSIGSDRGDFGNLRITGALRGGDAPDSGRVFFTGTLERATIGTIIGGEGANSGSIAGNFANDSIIGEAELRFVRVLGDVVGGSGANSGKVVAPAVGTVIVGSKANASDLVGGAGSDSGAIVGLTVSRVLVRGDVVGAAGTDSGLVFGSAGVGTVKVRGSLIGGEGIDSGALVSDGSLGAAFVFGNVQGGEGLRSGSVRAGAALNFLQIGRDLEAPGGNLQGGDGVSSGRVQVGDDLGAALITGSILGGAANDSGGVAVDGTLGVLQVQKNLEGGSAVAGQTLNNTGYVTANQIARLLIDGDLKSGTNNGDVLLRSGSVRAVGDIVQLRIGGDIVGNATARVVVSAAGQELSTLNQTIRFLAVGGDTAFADILGGYSPTASATNPRGVPVNPDAQIGTVKFGGAIEATNVVAGVVPGADGRFGTADDAVISGTDAAGVRSTIARLVIKGTVATNAEIYGVVAQVITAAKVGGATLPLKAGAQDDMPLGTATSNFRLRELPKPA